MNTAERRGAVSLLGGPAARRDRLLFLRLFCSKSNQVSLSWSVSSSSHNSHKTCCSTARARAARATIDATGRAHCGPSLLKGLICNL